MQSNVTWVPVILIFRKRNKEFYLQTDTQNTYKRI